MARYRIIRVWLSTMFMLVATGFCSLAMASTGSGSGAVRTPWSRGSSTETPLSCANCQANTTLVNNTWKTVSTGVYSVRFPGLGPAAGSSYVIHATSLNAPGVICAATGWNAGITDFTVSVTCTNKGQPANARFSLSVEVRQGTGWTVDEGYAAVQGGAIYGPGSWSSRGPTPVVNGEGVGWFLVRFPGLFDTSSGGNAQVTSTTAGVSCRLEWWGTSSVGTEISVHCQNSALQDVNSGFFVSYSNWRDGYFWTDQPSFNGTYTPTGYYARSVDGSSTVGQLATVTHASSTPGLYILNLSQFGGPGTFPEVTSYSGTADCTVIDLDSHAARVQCLNSNTGQPQDNAFSFRLVTFSIGIGWYAFAQVPVNGTNFGSTFDVGNGLICGQNVTANPGSVQCAPPAARGATGDVRLVGGGVVPGGGIKSIAIDNVDATTTNILVLGADGQVRISTGDLTGNWPSATNFGSWSQWASGIDPSYQRVPLKKIVVVRTMGSSKTDVLALTTTGGLLQFTKNSAGVRVLTPATSFPQPTGKTYKDVSHGRYDLHMLLSDNGMIRVVKNTGFEVLNTLPAGLLPVAMGGRHVLTNAGLTNGTYPCANPKDIYGNYTCAGDDNREYQWMTDNTWRSRGSGRYPTTDRAEVLTSGEPFVSATPAIVDAEMFEGNGNSFVAWQYFSRLYEWIE